MLGYETATPNLPCIISSNGRLTEWYTLKCQPVADPDKQPMSAGKGRRSLRCCWQGNAPHRLSAGDDIQDDLRCGVRTAHDVRFPPRSSVLVSFANPVAAQRAAGQRAVGTVKVTLGLSEPESARKP